MTPWSSTLGAASVVASSWGEVGRPCTRTTVPPAPSYAAVRSFRRLHGDVIANEPDSGETAATGASGNPVHVKIAPSPACEATATLVESANVGPEKFGVDGASATSVIV